MRFESNSSVRLLEGVEASAQSNTKRGKTAQRADANASSFNDMMTESMIHRQEPSRSERTHEQRDREPVHEAAHESRPARRTEKHEGRAAAKREAREQHDNAPNEVNAKPAKSDVQKTEKSEDTAQSAPQAEGQTKVEAEIQVEGEAAHPLLDAAIEATAAAEVNAETPETSEQKPAEAAAPQAKQITLPEQASVVAQLATQKARVEIQQAANENAELPAEGVVKETKGKLTAKLAKLGADVTAETPAETKAQTAQPQAIAVQAEKAEEKIIKTEIVLNFVEQMQMKVDKPAPAVGNAQSAPSGQIVALPSASQSFNAHFNAANAAAPQQMHQSAAEVSTMDALPFHVKRAVDQGKDIIELRLDPAELGKIEIRLERTIDNKMMAHITADRPETYQLLQKDASTLIRDMQNAGLDMDSTGMQFSLRQDNPEAQRNGQAALGNLPQSADQDDDLNEIPQSLIQNAAAYNRLYVPGRVDMRV